MRAWVTQYINHHAFSELETLCKQQYLHLPARATNIVEKSSVLRMLFARSQLRQQLVEYLRAITMIFWMSCQTINVMIE